MTTTVITFKKQQIPIVYGKGSLSLLQQLIRKMQEKETDFNFRRKLKGVRSIELVREMAIFQYTDGTKYYLEVS